ncbi:MAG: ATP-dependent helicase, partial [Sphingomonadales bacterium]
VEAPRAEQPRPAPVLEEKPREERQREAQPRDVQPRDARPREKRDERPARRDRRFEAQNDGPDGKDDGGWNGPIPDFLNFTIPA